MAKLFLKTLIQIVHMAADGIASLHFFLKGSWVMVSKGLEAGDLPSRKKWLWRDIWKQGDIRNMLAVWFCCDIGSMEQEEE